MKSFFRRICLLIAVFTVSGVASYAQSFLEPGVSYVAKQYIKNGNTFGISGPEYHSIEITTYKDGSASGIYSIGLHYYDEDGSFKVKLTGRWKNISKYDKKVIDIFLKYEDESNYESFHIYVDSSKMAYLRDLNSTPVVLTEKKPELKEPEFESFTQNDQTREMNAKRDEETLVPYEVIDLGLSVKWGNLNAYSSRGRLRETDEQQIDYSNLFDKWPKREERKEYGFIKRKSIEKFERTGWYDPLEDYVAGGKHHGDPIPKNKITDIFDNPMRGSGDSQYKLIEHTPTTAEWKELMDNCTIAVDTLHDYFYAWYESSQQIRKICDDTPFIRLTSKINGKSIVLPFGSYRTCQFLSSNPDMATCVCVDESGLSFVERERGRYQDTRMVYGEINKDVLQPGIQKARASVLTEAWYLEKIEQEKLEQEYEEQLWNHVSRIDAPTVSVNGENLRIIAPVRNIGDVKYTYVCFARDGERSWKDYRVQVQHKNKYGYKYGYIECEVPLSNFNSEWFNIYFLSYNDIFVGYQTLNDDIKESSTADFEKSTKEFVKFKNEYQKQNERRYLVSPVTRFKVGKYKSINYDSDYLMPPVPQINQPVVLNIGTPKGKKEITYNNVEVAFDITEEKAWPVEHPRLEDVYFSVVGQEKEKINIQSNGLTGNTHKYIIKKLHAETPYKFTVTVIDQYGGIYKKRVTITLKPDGTVSYEML